MDGDVSILLEDFHQVVTLGVHPDSAPSMVNRAFIMAFCCERGDVLQAALLGVFVQVDPACPHQVSLAGLLANKAASDILHHAMGYLLAVSSLSQAKHSLTYTLHDCIFGM